MRAIDLRIGNWYNSVKFNQPVKCELSDLRELYIMSDGAYNDPPIDEMFEPLPLTEEWLIKFGFEKVKAKSGIQSAYKKHGIRIEISNSGNTYYKSISNPYVHQLQDLYLALKRKELIIKS